MSYLVIFGRLKKPLEERIIELRKEIRELGYDSGEQYLYALPHLTLVTTTKFEDETQELKSIIENLNIERFTLEIEDIIEIDNNLALKFNNSQSAQLAREISFALKDFNFEPIETYFMKIIRSEVKKKYIEKAKKMLREIIPDKVEIISICAAGGNLTKEDIYWNINLK